MTRIFDFTFALLGMILLSPIFLLVVFIGFFDTGSPVFVQTRVGKNKQPFNLVKFRTMAVNTKSVATHLATSSSITKLGSLLRKSKIDELPQLINVLKGDMSLVGPRPNLFNQEELILFRDKHHVYDVVPGITGLSQINTIDMSTPELLAKTDREMINNYSIKNYFSYIFKTISGHGSGDRIIS